MRTLIQVITISSISCCLRNVEFVICLLLITKAMFLSLELCDCRGCCRLCFFLAIVALLLLQVDYQGNVTLLTQGIYMTKCQIDVTHYPFDPQVSISNHPVEQLS